MQQRQEQMNQRPARVYGIPPWNPPTAMESYCILFEAFSPKECQDMIDLAELLEFKKGTVGNNHTDDKIRNSNITWITDDPSQPALDARRYMIDRAIATISRVNGEKFDMDLDHFESLQFTRYDLNQHYDWHVDVHEGQPMNSHRKLSMVIGLTDPDSYEGGDLLLNLGGNPDTPMTLRVPLGGAVFFYSHIPHKVTPVTKGSRATLVTWAMGPRIR